MNKKSTTMNVMLIWPYIDLEKALIHTFTDILGKTHYDIVYCDLKLLYIVIARYKNSKHGTILYTQYTLGWIFFYLCLH